MVNVTPESVTEAKNRLVGQAEAFFGGRSRLFRELTRDDCFFVTG